MTTRTRTSDLSHINPLVVPRKKLRLHRLDNKQEVAVDLQP